jgi:hypothetical protein
VIDITEPSLGWEKQVTVDLRLGVGQKVQTFERIRRDKKFSKARTRRAARKRTHTLTLFEIRIGISPRHCERSDLSAGAQRAKAEAIHLAAREGMDCFVAEPVIGRAFARPVDSSQ